MIKWLVIGVAAYLLWKNMNSSKEKTTAALPGLPPAVKTILFTTDPTVAGQTIGDTTFQLKEKDKTYVGTGVSTSLLSSVNLISSDPLAAFAMRKKSMI